MAGLINLSAYSDAHVPPAAFGHRGPAVNGVLSHCQGTRMIGWNGWGLLMGVGGEKRWRFPYTHPSVIIRLLAVYDKAS